MTITQNTNKDQDTYSRCHSRQETLNEYMQSEAKRKKKGHQFD